MARKSLEDQLAELHALRGATETPEARTQLLNALRRGVNHVAAKAAELLADARDAEVEPALVQAFDRFMSDPLKIDKGCVAKTAIAAALHQMHAPADQVYLRGIRYVQLEPTYGGRADTAASLRGLCAMGLVDMNHPDALLHVVPLLCDPERQARIAAVRALAASGRDDAAHVLNLKAHIGADDPDVLSETLGALLSLWRERALPIVGDLIDRAGAAGTREVAVLALGSSRLPGVLTMIRERYERDIDGEFRRVCLLALVMHRSDDATSFVLEQLRDGSSQAAENALAALATFRHDAVLLRRVRDAVEQRGDRAIHAVFASQFGDQVSS